MKPDDIQDLPDDDAHLLLNPLLDSCFCSVIDTLHDYVVWLTLLASCTLTSSTMFGLLKLQAVQTCILHVMVSTSLGASKDSDKAPCIC